MREREKEIQTRVSTGFHPGDGGEKCEIKDVHPQRERERER